MEKINYRETAFIFPGQGSQFCNMGKNIYNAIPRVRETFEMVSEVIRKDLKKIIFSDDLEKLTITTNAQPAIMTVSIAVLNAILEYVSRDIDSIVSCAAGHSLGEYTALCASQSISLENIAKILSIRANAMANATPNSNEYGMAALLGCDLENANKILERANKFGQCSIANDNGGEQFVVSGEKKALEAIHDMAKEYNIKKVINLNVSSAFHSPFMKSAESAISQSLHEINISKPIITIIANYTAKQVTEAADIKEALVKQVSNQVRWRESVIYMNQKLGIKTFVEIGPGTVLTKLISRTMQTVRTINVCSLEEIESFCKML